VPEKILIVDDEREIREVLSRYLGLMGFATIAADDASEALLMARDSRPDLVLCDAGLPGLDGRALCRRLKADAATRGIPVVLMSGSLVADADVVGGLEDQADDYVLKPLSLPVLLARLKTALRRARADGRSEAVLRAGSVELDRAGRSVAVEGRPVALTRKEFDLLELLLAKRGRALPVAYLLETVWGYDPTRYNDPSTVEVHVSRLRRKLGRSAAALIVTVPGHGYKLVQPDLSCAYAGSKRRPLHSRRELDYPPGGRRRTREGDAGPDARGGGAAGARGQQRRRGARRGGERRSRPGPA